jgi:hypothetical protein
MSERKPFEMAYTILVCPECGRDRAQGTGERATCVCGWRGNWNEMKGSDLLGSPNI